MEGKGKHKRTFCLFWSSSNQAHLFSPVLQTNEFEAIEMTKEEYGNGEAASGGGGGRRRPW